MFDDPIRPADLAEMLLAAPVVTRLGLTVPNERHRRRAANDLACFILGEQPHDHRDQLALPL